MFNLGDEINHIYDKDPAARSHLEIMLCYPGLHAIFAHQFANWFYKRHCFVLAKLIAQISRFFTGIEIHPGSKLGRHLFIDHGMGVVIGETAEVGDDCIIYQGVTLGATADARKGALTRDKKRHPTLGTSVVIGSGAQVLGAVNIGDNVQIASGSIVLKDIPANCIVAGVPGKIIYRDGIKIEDKVSEAEVIASMSDPRELFAHGAGI